MTIPEIENGVQTTNTLSNNLGAKITKFGIGGIYVAMTIIYLWFGGMKFTSYEANGIHGFVSNSPLLSWMYSFLSIQGFSNFLGVLEISVGLLIAARVFSLSSQSWAVYFQPDSFYDIVVHADYTRCFEASLGFPAISVVPGQFLLKDLGLFVVSIFIVGTSLTALEHKNK